MFDSRVTGTDTATALQLVSGEAFDGGIRQKITAAKNAYVPQNGVFYLTHYDAVGETRFFYSGKVWKQLPIWQEFHAAVCYCEQATPTHLSFTIKDSHALIHSEAGYYATLWYTPAARASVVPNGKMWHPQDVLEEVLTLSSDLVAQTLGKFFTFRVPRSQTSPQAVTRALTSPDVADQDLSVVNAILDGLPPDSKPNLWDLQNFLQSARATLRT